MFRDEKHGKRTGRIVGKFRSIARLRDSNKGKVAGWAIDPMNVSMRWYGHGRIPESGTGSEERVMELNSVRELKFALSETVLPGMQTHFMTRGAARVVRAGLFPPKLALGVFVRGKGDYALAVRIQHRAMESGREIELIRNAAKGEVDVRYIGMVHKRAQPWHQVRQRPLQIGCSVGHYRITAGTLGAFVRPHGGGAMALLSNNHVLADENQAKKGNAILQPGAFDGDAHPEDQVAQLAEFVRLNKVGSNRLDCATATLVDGLEYHPLKIKGIGNLEGVGDVSTAMDVEVSKLGRTTGLTHGRVTAFELDDVIIGYDMGFLQFTDQIEIEGVGDGPFSDGGDSGALIVSGDRRAMGLLFAGSDQGSANGQGLTYANPIQAVLDTLRVEFPF